MEEREKDGVWWIRSCGLQVDFQKDEGLKCKIIVMYVPPVALPFYW
jgi:hypothetical protein